MTSEPKNWGENVQKKTKTGLFRESNPGPLAPKARIMPLDQTAKLKLFCPFLPREMKLKKCKTPRDAPKKWPLWQLGLVAQLVAASEKI